MQHIGTRIKQHDFAVLRHHEQQIAHEYVPTVGADGYLLGRRRFLEGLLKRDRIFLSDDFHQRFDAQARANLRAALK